MTRTLLLALSLILPSISGAGVYKCTQPDGRVVYQNTQCIEEADQDLVGIDRTPRNTGDAAKQNRVNACFEYHRSHLKDPYTAVFHGGGEEPVALRNYEVVARRVWVWINSKNQYGGYDGKKAYTCYMTTYGKMIFDAQVIK